MASSVSELHKAGPDDIRFGEFHLAMSEARLFRGKTLVPLSPKGLGVLHFLAARAGRLVTKDELLDVVWERRFIGEGVIKNVVQELRQALGDNPKAPRFIETVHGRGYRFIADTHSAEHPVTPVGGPEPGEIPVVGRADVLERLHGWLGQSLAGQPRLVFLNGEPGIGKTTLVRHLAASLPADVLILEGHCIEQYGQAEPYLPVLEALNGLGRLDRAALVDCLRRCAPIWLAQLPWLLDEPERSALIEQTRGMTKDRMLREFGVFLREWTAGRPLLLVLEDLHWSDNATLDLIRYLARPGTSGRWMILASYRPVDVIVSEHPLREVLRGLLLHGLCHDLSLDLLSEAAAADYLSRRFPSARFTDAGVRAIHARTEGLPLFLVRLADALVGQADATGGYPQPVLERFLTTFPEGLRVLVEMQFDRLPAAGRRLLDAAAVCHRGLSAPALAAVADTSVLDAEVWCEAMVGAGNLLRRSDAPVRVAQRDPRRYEFIHAYYQELAYQGILPSRLAELHRRAGVWFEDTCGARMDDMAAELALHFEMGRQYPKAVEYLSRAAENAAARHAPHEVCGLLRRALDLLDNSVAAAPKPVRTRLALLARLATAIQTTHGFAATELEPIYRQIADQAIAADCAGEMLALLWGAWGFYCARGQFDEAAVRVQRMDAIIELVDASVWRIGSHAAMGGVHWHRGEVAAARRHLEAGLALYGDATRPELYPVFTQDPDVLCRLFLGLVYASQGEPERARATVAIARERAGELGHPFTEAFALWADCMVSQYLGELERVRTLSERMHATAEAHGFTMLVAMADVFRGFAALPSGADEAGIARMQDGLDLLQATGARMWLSYFYALLADAHRLGGRPAAGLAAPDRATAAVRQYGERFFEAEIGHIRQALVSDAG